MHTRYVTLTLDFGREGVDFELMAGSLKNLLYDQTCAEMVLADAGWCLALEPTPVKKMEST